MASYSFGQYTQGFLYGSVLLKNGNTYRGQIRWEEEEAMWDDKFDAEKHDQAHGSLTENPDFLKSRTGSDDFGFGFMELWADKSSDASFQLRCHFGEIVRLDVRDDWVEMALKNGRSIRLKKDHGDVSEDIIIYDQDFGKIDVDFDQVKSIAFQATPNDLLSQMGNPIYAEILTTMGSYEGYITWDGEECLGKDVISGEKDGIRIDLDFENIKSLKAQEDGSLIRMKSGKEIYLDDHDDVDDGNHGISIRNMDYGFLIIPWKNFISANFIQPPVTPTSYSDFGVPTLLSGKVIRKDGLVHSGDIMFNLNQIYNVEFARGKNSDFVHYIQMGQISSIIPQNDRFSLVKLKNESEYLLGDSGDFTFDNHGLIITLSDNSAEYIPWTDINEITFD